MIDRAGNGNRRETGLHDGAGRGEVMRMICCRRLCALLAPFALAGVIAGCSQGDASVECPPVLDTVEQLLIKAHGEKNYFLVKRVAGWHDKTIVLQLYDQKPVLNACNEDLVLPIYENSLDDERSVTTLVADLERQSFEVVYGDGGDGKSAVELEFR